MNRIYLLIFFFFILLSCNKSNVVELNFAFYDADEANQFIEENIKVFGERNPDIKVNKIIISKDNLVKRLKEKSIKVDIIRYSSNFLEDFITKKIIINFDELFESSFYDKIIKKALLTTTHNDNIWGIPDNYGNHILLFYNKKIVKEIPNNTDELIKLLVRKTKYNSGRYGIVFNQKEPNFIYPWFYGFGLVSFFDNENNTIDRKEIINAFDFVYKLKYKYELLPDDCNYEKAENLFKSGNAAIIINGDWAVNEYRQILNDNLGVSEFPTVSITGKMPMTWASTMCYSIIRGTGKKKEKAAIKFIEYMTSEEMQEEWLKFYRLPSVKSSTIEEKIKLDTVINLSYQALLKSQPKPSNKDLFLLTKAIRPHLDLLINGEVSPQMAVYEAEQYYRELIKVKDEKK